MGLFGAYLAYRHGKKKARRAADRDMHDLERRLADIESREGSGDDDDDEICDSCGHRRAQHSDDDPPLCPSY